MTEQLTRFPTHECPCEAGGKFASQLENSIHELSGDVKMLSDTVTKAFPAGDIEGHRRYHEVMIADLESRKKLTQAIIEKTVSGLIWSAVVGIGIAVWYELGNLLRK